MLPTLLCALLAFALVWCCSCLKPRNFPPGPAWFPLIGCFAQFEWMRRKQGYMYLAFEELYQKYGPIVGLKLGHQRFVLISGHDMVRKVLLTDEFNGRPDGFFFRVRSFGKKKGLLFTEGKQWTQMRKFTTKQLKAFGFGQEAMAQWLAIEAQNLVDSLRRQAEEGPVLMHTAFDVAVLNSLWMMFAGHRFENDDRKLKEILDIVHDVFRLNDALGGILSHLPYLRFIIPEWSGYNELLTVLERLWNFLSDEIHQHEVSLPVDEPHDLIDAFLMEIKTRPDNDPDDETSVFDRQNLLILCLDLFLAGSKTTTDSLAMFVAYLANNQHCVQELQQELNNVIGRSRLPAIADIPNLPKIEAFIAEAQRSLTLAPVGIPHKTMSDIQLEGYSIPKDTTVLLNFHSVHYDAKHWKKPEEFRIQRFLNNEGKLFQPNSSLLPFGFGKRRCMGESLARSSLFLFLAYLLHHFDLRLSERYGPPDLNGYDGFVISPKPYYLVLKSRE